MRTGRLRQRAAFSLPLHPGAGRRLRQLTGEYSDALVSQARLVAHGYGAMQVSERHVDRAYHILQLAPRSGGREIGKIASGSLFGAGITMVGVGLQAEPAIVWLTIAGVAACVGGVGLMGWVGVTERAL